MRNVQVIGKQELQRMLAGVELKLRFGAAIPEVYVLGIRRNRRVQWRQAGVDQHVVMTAVLRLCTRRYDFHLLDTEFDTNRARDNIAVLRRNEVHARRLGGG